MREPADFVCPKCGQDCVKVYDTEYMDGMVFKMAECENCETEMCGIYEPELVDIEVYDS